MSQVGDVVHPLVGGAVGADDAGAVHGQCDVQILQAHVVDDLVIGSLQEGGVDRGHGLHSLRGESGREGHGVLLGDADVVEAARELLCKPVETGSVGHGGGDADDAMVFPGETDQRLGEDPLVLGWTGLRLVELPRRHVEAPDPVIPVGIVLGRLVAVALGGEGMNQDGPVAVGEHGLHVLEGLQHHVDAVPLDRPHVLEVQRLEEESRREEDLEGLLGLLRPVQHVAGHRREELLHPALHAPHHGRGHLSRKRL
jgi:hypothetical protein